MIEVLIVHDSHRPGSLIEQLAGSVAAGVDEVPEVQSRTVHINDLTRDDLARSAALILGSPNWSGISGNLKQRLDDLGDLWAEGVLTDKVGAAFTAGTSRHAGLEFTLLTIIHWLLSGGMIFAGLPWQESMRVSGSYYGATAAGSVEEADRAQARRLGRRVAELTLRLGPGATETPR
ncbi:MAG TPA: NAD(P)H-dependent oxidoreductase [Dehalococcoidia bacterium]|nr:NAD(P)H-dependent oxidoreductase [Dehalococcoidia bacterium]